MSCLFEYELIRSDRRTMSLEIKPNGTLVVRAPKCMAVSEIERILTEKSSWIHNHLRHIPVGITSLTESEIQSLKQRAGADLQERVSRFAPIIGVTISRVTIRAQQTRWGSCSAKGNINFNCLLMLVPERVRDYVVVHELCHRRHLDHSPLFWQAVEQVMPDWKEQRRWLKEHGGAFLARIPQK